jgi:hypothetical protein
MDFESSAPACRQAGLLFRHLGVVNTLPENSTYFKIVTNWLQ